MSVATTAKTIIPDRTDTRVLARILEEGYGPGAWHGADLKAALADVDPALAFWRPAPGRHNIAELAVHHAYCIRSVRGQLAGATPAPFVLDGDDWFTLPDESKISWAEITALVGAEQERLTTLVGEIGSGRVRSPLTDVERFDLVVGITCHAVYHAGQAQLIKRLRA